MFSYLQLETGLALLVEFALEVCSELLDVALVGEHQLPALLVQTLDLPVPVYQQAWRQHSNNEVNVVILSTSTVSYNINNNHNNSANSTLYCYPYYHTTIVTPTTHLSRTSF